MKSGVSSHMRRPATPPSVLAAEAQANNISESEAAPNRMRCERKSVVTSSRARGKRRKGGG